METPQQPINQQELPNATLVLVFGILSIVTCVCYGFPGLVLGIVAIVLANKSAKMYKAFPDTYTAASYSNLKAGKICAIIGVSLSALFVLVFIAYIVFWGFVFTSVFPWNEVMQQTY